MNTLRTARLICATSICLALASCSHFMSQPTLLERQALCDQLDILEKKDYEKVKRHPAQVAEFNEALVQSLNKVLTHYEAPKWDGKKYYGEIKIDLDAEGLIVQTLLAEPSGSSVLDEAMLKAANSTEQLVLPEDKCVARLMTSCPVILHYSEEDMK